MPRKIRCSIFFHVCHCPIDRFVGTVRLWRSGEEHHGFCNGNTGFGQPQLEGTVHACLCDDNCLRICQPHVLCRNDQQPPADGQQIICRQQSCRIVQGCIFVGAANGLLQGRQQIIVLVVVPIVSHVAALRQFLCQFIGNDNAVFGVFTGQHDQFHRVHGFADIAAAAPCDPAADTV